MTKNVIKAALNGQARFKGKCYLFHGERYIRSSWKENLYEGYAHPDVEPRNLSLWKLGNEFNKGIDAAINGNHRFDGYAYLFKGDKYLKYDWEKDQPMGQPRSLKLWQLSGDFLKGIDAACNGKGKYSGFGYLFKGNKYVKYDWNKDEPVGKPRSIELWRLPNKFSSGIDAAIDGDGKFSDYTFFFKGDEYVIYNWNNFSVEEPKPIHKGWYIGNRLIDDLNSTYHNNNLEEKISYEAFKYGYLGLYKLGDLDCPIPDVKKINSKGKREKISKKHFDNLAIIDFTKPSNQKRLVVWNRKSGQVTHHLLVSHGTNTAGRGQGQRKYARFFSNTKDTNKSSLGFFMTGWTFRHDKVKNGKTEERVWLKLHGLEPGLNDNAQARGIMMHTADYVNEAKGRAGTSHGCPAIDPLENHWVNNKLKNRFLNLIEGNTLLFQYTTKTFAADENGMNYYDHSEIIQRLDEYSDDVFRVS